MVAVEYITNGFIISCVENVVNKNDKEYIILKDKDNLTKEEKLTLQELSNNENLVIKPADKGGCIVIQNTKDYLHEAYKQLNDKQYYKRINQPLQTINKIRINKILNNLNNLKYITDEQLTFLSGPEKPRMRLFYTLPKIHKEISEWSVPYKIPKGRPIVSDIGSESYRISQYIDYFLKPLAYKHESYIKNLI